MKAKRRKKGLKKCAKANIWAPGNEKIQEEEKRRRRGRRSLPILLPDSALKFVIYFILHHFVVEI